MEQKRNHVVPDWVIYLAQLNVRLLHQLGKAVVAVVAVLAVDLAAVFETV